MDLFQDSDSRLFVAEDEAKQIVATLHAHHRFKSTHFSLFSVEPVEQGNGIGKQLLAFAETESSRIWGADCAIMEVISLRSELIDYYERRGYKATGETIPFPVSTLWTPHRHSLELAVLEKRF